MMVANQRASVNNFLLKIYKYSLYKSGIQGAKVLGGVVKGVCPGEEGSPQEFSTAPLRGVGKPVGNLPEIFGKIRLDKE